MVLLKKRTFIIIPIIFFIGLAALFVYKGGRTVTIIGNNSSGFWKETAAIFDSLPEPEEDRIDILIVGIRGFQDGEDRSEGGSNGEYLADTIILASFNKENDRAALVSIPRDLYVDIPEYGMEKINSAYAIGEARQYGGGGLQLTRALVSAISGVYVDHVVSVDFEGFEKIIDQIGGIVIYRDTPFVEGKQWIHDGQEGKRYWRFRQESTTTEAGWEFYVPKGENIMNSEEALYYARSRYSSSDFDRMRRQQEVISMIKSKALNLGVIANPVKIFGILDTLENNVRSDIEVSQMKELLFIIQKAKIQDLKKAVLDTSDDGLLVEDRVEGRFVLLPKDGDYSQIRELFKSIVE